MYNYPKWKIALVGVLTALGLFFCAPNFMSEAQRQKLPEWWHPITLGLDLQGGSQLLLQVDLDQVVTDQMNAVMEASRTTLREKNVRYKGLFVKDGVLFVTIIKDSQIAKARELLRQVDKGSLEITEEKNNLLTVRFTEIALTKMKKNAVDQSIEIVRRRIDQLGTREPSIMRQGNDRIQVQLPGVENPGDVKKLLGKTAKMSFHLVDETTTLADARRGKISPESKVVQGAEDSDSAYYVIERKSIVGGEHLTDARADFQEGQPVVAFRFNSFGSKRFGQATRENIGRRLAIVLDGHVITAPEVKSAITGGGIISGNFTVQSANDLALMLRSGALPAPLEVVEERIVGPGLGTDSIDAGKTACLIGAVLILIFVIATYGLFGLFADVALILNIVLLFGLMSAIGATLTLPGIAGIALTMGMAVDANVLIYERMREEQSFGRSVLNTIEAGFDNAYSAIFDSNLTTMFAGFVLIWLGNGPVRGFGVTTCLGLLTSVFTAVCVTKVLILAWVKIKKPKALNV